MVPVTALWLPILVAAVLIFVASSIIHMVIGYHNSDYRRLPAEDDVMDALRRFNLPPGDYAMPLPANMRQMNAADYLAKREKGPVAFLSIWKPGPPTMTKQLGLWFVYSVVVSLFAGYVAGITLGPGAPYMTVFRVTGTVAFASYTLALWPFAIWYNRSLSVTLKSTLDGLIYGLLTAGSFGWLWPQ